MKNENSFLKIAPILFGFFVMGFVDVVGISTSYVKQDFDLSDTLANLLPMMVFLWFAVFSVPVGLLMNNLGRKKTVLLSMLFTIVGLLIPLATYTYSVMLVAFALIGIGNTILQVSLNPLVSNVVRANRLTSTLTLGQFVKAIASFSGPIIAGFAATALGNWKLLFPIFAFITIISSLWLLLTPIAKDEKLETTTSFRAAFSLLGDKVILLLFLGIVFVVGVDVGMNLATPMFLMDRTGLSLEQAGLGTSLYFAARTAGALIGAFILAKFSSILFFRLSIITAVVFMVFMTMSSNMYSILFSVAAIGFFVANIFPIIFSIALQYYPSRANEVSGLMIMGVSGGALLPPIMGVVSDVFGQTGSMFVILAAMLYLVFAAFIIKAKKDEA